MTSEKTAKLSPIVESPAIYSDPPDPTEEFEAEIDTTVIEKPETKHPLCDYYDENDENDRSGSDDELLGCPENAKSLKSQAPQGFSGCLDIENDEMNKKNFLSASPRVKQTLRSL